MKRISWVAAVVCTTAAMAMGAAGQAFTNVGSMSVARNMAAAVLLGNGTVLIAGGVQSGSETPLASAEIYDPSSATFHTTGSMSMGRAGAWAEPLPGGGAIVIGGETLNGGLGGLASSTELYDATAGTFTVGPNLPVGLEGPMATLLEDGRIWVTGLAQGCTMQYLCPSPVYIYDPKTNGFSADGGLQYARSLATLVALANDTVLIVGGYGDNPGTSPLSSYEIYDPATGVSTLETNAIGIGTAAASGVLLQNSQVLLCGGDTHFGATNECDLYDPTAGTWTQTSSMQQQRLTPVGFRLPDGSVLEASNEQNPNAELYDGSGHFSNVGNFNTERSQFSVVQLQNGDVLFAGGGTATAEVFTPGATEPDFELTTPRFEVTTATLTATAPITATGTGGFGGSIGLSCTPDAKAGVVQCTFSPASITPGQTSTMTITTQNSGGYFHVVGTSGNLTNSLPMEVSVQPPVASATPATLSFPDTAVGVTSPGQMIMVNNEGGTVLHITGIAASGDFSETNNCPAAIANGAQGCTVTVTFTPTQSGARTGTVSVSDDSPQPQSPQTVALSGTGTAAPAPAAGVAPGSLSFGSVNDGATSGAQTVTLSNSGNAALTGVAVAVTGEFTEANNCGATVAAGGNCAIAVTFAPTGSGNQSGMVSVSDNAAHSPQQVVLSGAGVAPPPQAGDPALSPTSLTFGQQTVGTTSNSQNITLDNSGNAAEAVSGVAAIGDFAESNTCGTSVDAGKSCAIAVTFTPTAAGQRQGQLTVTVSGGSPLTATLTGTGAAAGGGGGGGVSFAPPSGGTATATVAPGGSASYALDLTATSGFSGAVTLACTGAPSGAVCTPTPATMTASATATAVTVAVTTSAGSSLWWMAWEWWGLCGFLLALPWAMPRRRKLVLLGAAAVALAGCGGSAAQTTNTGGGGMTGATPAGSYTLTVTATSNGASVGSENLTLVVQ